MDFLTEFPAQFDRALPDFTSEGLLPPGDYLPRQTEFERRFVESGGEFTAASDAGDYRRMFDRLSALTVEHETLARRSSRVSRAAGWAVVAASIGSMLAVYSAATGFAAVLSPLLVLPAFHYAALVAERARRHEQMAARVSTLRAEIEVAFGPDGKVLRPSEYYAASAKRMESLIAGIETDTRSQ